MKSLNLNAVLNESRLKMIPKRPQLKTVKVKNIPELNPVMKIP